MFGYLAADTGHLTPEELSRYKACYCGLCRTLQDRHGIQARLTLNYDMTFLILLLQSLHEPEESGGEEPCLVHPIQSRPWQRSEITAYAADLNLALAYLKCLDNWEDDGSLLALGEAKALRKAYDAVCGRYPRQCAVMQTSLSIDQAFCYLPSCAFINSSNCRSGYAHSLGAFLLLKTFLIEQTDSFIFIKTHDHDF